MWAWHSVDGLHGITDSPASPVGPIQGGHNGYSFRQNATLPYIGALATLVLARLLISRG